MNKIHKDESHEYSATKLKNLMHTIKTAQTLLNEVGSIPNENYTFDEISNLMSYTQENHKEVYDIIHQIQITSSERLDSITPESKELDQSIHKDESHEYSKTKLKNLMHTTVTAQTLLNEVGSMLNENYTFDEISNLMLDTQENHKKIQKVETTIKEMLLQQSVIWMRGKIKSGAFSKKIIPPK